MNETPDTIDTLNEKLIAVARRYLSLGFKPIPLVPGTKQAALRWKRFQTQAPSESEVIEFFSSGEPNIGLVTGNGPVVVDIDDPALLQAVIDHCGDTPMKCRTPSGGLHLYFGMRKGVHYGNAVKIRNRPIDLRGEGAYACAPWSRNAEGKPYEWLADVLPVSELPLLRVSWLREKSPARSYKPVEQVIRDGVSGTRTSLSRIKNPEAYCMTIESVEGQNGSSALVRAVCVLRDAGRTAEEAFVFLVENWNESCAFPPWSEREIEYAVRRHFRA